MIGYTRSVVLTGMTGHVIDVEAHLAPSLPSFTLVGLPDASLHESRERVRAAVASSGLVWPQRRITVNLSPAALPKSGSVTDLAIAVAVLSGAGYVDTHAAARAVHLGELGLDGYVRPVRGILPSVLAARDAGLSHVVVPEGNAAEAALVPGMTVTTATSLAELAARYGNPDATAATRNSHRRVAQDAGAPPPVLDLADVRGQQHARWALEVAAAGGHHLLMVGPPGAGKTMLAERLPGILPPLTPAQSLEVTSLHSIAGTLDATGRLIETPPFEAPHHCSSAAAVVGGGARMARPGAISRAHCGVLFLDEAPEFPAAVLQTLRQPLESGSIVLHRSDGAARYPARFQLILAANPCPCGNYFGKGESCTCTPMSRRRYLARMSGPLLDRVDIQVDVLPVTAHDQEQGEPSAAVAARVAAARLTASERFAEQGWWCTAQASGQWLRAHTPVAAARVVFSAMEQGRLTARGADRALRVAWTLADLDGAPEPGQEHVLSAMMLRSRDGS